MVAGTHRVKTVCLICPTLDEASSITNNWRHLIRLIRQKYQVSEADLGRTLGVDQSTIHRWESGEREPDIFNYEAIKLWAKQLIERSAFS